MSGKPDRIRSLLREVKKDTLFKHLTALVGERNHQTAPDGLIRAMDYLEGGFRRMGLEVAPHAFEVKRESHLNVIATISGKSDAAPPLILGAHYDTVKGSPGADDNASGLSVLLTVADILRWIELDSPVQLAAFGMEEQGLLGSTAYVQKLRKDGRAIRGAIILECVGYADHREGSQEVPPGLPVTVPTTGDFLGVIANQYSTGFKEGVEKAMKRYVPGLPTVGLVVPGTGEALPDVRRSDHAPFWDMGLPALMLTDTANFRNPHYHQPTDTLETLDLEFLVNVTRGVLAGLVQLS